MAAGQTYVSWLKPPETTLSPAYATALPDLVCRSRPNIQHRCLPLCRSSGRHARSFLSYLEPTVTPRIQIAVFDMDKDVSKEQRNQSSPESRVIIHAENFGDRYLTRDDACCRSSSHFCAGIVLTQKTYNLTSTRSLRQLFRCSVS